MSTRRCNSSRSEVRKFLEDVSVWVNGCWQWIGDVNRSNAGYGCFYHRGRRILAHRYMWELMNDRAVPDGFVIMHCCDNTLCVNPDHLLLGTQQENIADMIAKDRARAVGPPRMVTNDVFEAARKMRRHGNTAQEIAAAFNLGVSTVQHILAPHSRYETKHHDLERQHFTNVEEGVPNV